MLSPAFLDRHTDRLGRTQTETALSALRLVGIAVRFSPFAVQTACQQNRNLTALDAFAGAFAAKVNSYARCVEGILLSNFPSPCGEDQQCPNTRRLCILVQQEFPRLSHVHACGFPPLTPTVLNMEPSTFVSLTPAPRQARAKAPASWPSSTRIEGNYPIASCVVMCLCPFNVFDSVSCCGRTVREKPIQHEESRAKDDPHSLPALSPTRCLPKPRAGEYASACLVRLSILRLRAGVPVPTVCHQIGASWWECFRSVLGCARVASGLRVLGLSNALTPCGDHSFRTRRNVHSRLGFLVRRSQSARLSAFFRSLSLRKQKRSSAGCFVG